MVLQSCDWEPWHPPPFSSTGISTEIAVKCADWPLLATIENAVTRGNAQHVLA